MANQSIIRAMQVLNLFSYEQPAWRGRELAKEVDLPPTTVHGILRTLEQGGFLIQDAVSKEYRLGQKLNILGAVQRATLELNQKASAPINYLFRQVGLECRVGVFYQDMVLITTTTGHMASTAGIAYTGPLLPTYCSALGRAILSCLTPKQVKAHFQKIELIAYTPNTVTDPEIINKELEETRQRGYSLELQEVTMNMESVGAPILGAGPQPEGAICLVGSPSQLSGKGIEDITEAIINTAGEISSYMGHHSRPVVR